MSERHENEIREILNRMDRFLPDEGKQPAGRRQPSRGQPVPSLLSWFARPERVMLAGIAIILFAGFAPTVLGWISPRLFGQFAAALGLVGFALLATGYVASIVQARRRPPERRWRGQVIRFTPRFEGSNSSFQYRRWQLQMLLRRWLRLP